MVVNRCVPPNRCCFVFRPEGFHINSWQQTSHIFLGHCPKFLRPAYPRGETSVMLLSWVFALMDKFNLTVPALHFQMNLCLTYWLVELPRFALLWTWVPWLVPFMPLPSYPVQCLPASFLHCNYCLFLKVHRIRGLACHRALWLIASCLMGCFLW